MRILTEDQSMIRDSAAGVLAGTDTIAKLRAMRSAGGGTPEAIEAMMAEMGWAGMLAPESAGGVDMGAEAAGLIAEEMGRHLANAPFLSSSVMAATALRQIGEADWLAKLTNGAATIALAMDEARRHNPDAIETVATKSGNGFSLTGFKRFIDGGAGATRLIVTARMDDELALFLIDPAVKGVTLDKVATLDARDAANARFDDVQLDGAALLASGEAAENALGAALRVGRAVAAAELLGVSKEAAERTTAYLKERKQFGMTLASFQALQHRAADLYTQIQSAEAAAAAALRAIDNGADDAEFQSRVAKAKASKTAMQAVREAVQMHGGVGMTDALDIGLFMKKARAAAEYLGDEACHGEWLLRQRGL